jgi:DNA-directed RNA polymerase specialized sigma subunit
VLGEELEDFSHREDISPAQKEELAEEKDGIIKELILDGKISPQDLSSASQEAFKILHFRSQKETSLPPQHIYKTDSNRTVKRRAQFIREKFKDPLCAKIISLYFHQNLSCGEISETLNLSEYIIKTVVDKVTAEMDEFVGQSEP